MSEDQQSQQGQRADGANLLLIVVGAHLRAEVADRPLAYRLRERIHAWLEKYGPGINVGLIPVVCSDVWYMNQEALHKILEEYGVPLVYTATDFWTFCPVVDLRRHDGTEEAPATTVGERPHADR